MRALALPLIVTLVMSAFPPRVIASEAEDLFEQGRAALQESKLDLACDLFKRSQALDGAPGTLLNLADCEERRGNRVVAHGLFAEVARNLDPLFSTEGKKRALKLTGQLSKITVRVAGELPIGARLTMDGVDITFNEARFVEPGPHMVVLSAPSLIADDTKRETLVAGQALDLTFTINPTTSSNDTAAGLPGVGVAGIVIASVGVATVASAIGTGVAMLGVGACFPDEGLPDDSACDRTSAAADEGRALEAASTALFIAGGVLSATGIVLLAVAPWGGEADRPATVSLSFGFARAQLVLSF